MKDSNFEKKYNKVLQNYEAPLDTNTFWDELEPNLPEKDKRKRRFLFWFFFGLGLSALAGWLLPANSNALLPPNSLTKAQETQSNQNSKKILNHNKQQKSLTPNNTIKPSVDQTINNNEIINATKPKMVAIKPNITSKTKTYSSPFSGTKKYNKGLDHSITKDKSRKKLSQLANPTPQSTPQTTLTSQKHLKEKKATVKKKVTKKKKAKQRKRVKIQKRKWQPVFYAWTGTSYAFHSYNTQSKESYFQVLKDARQKVIKNIGTYSAGASMNLIYENGFLLSTGIYYRRHSEVFEILEKKEDAIVLKNETIKQIVDGNGNIVQSYKGAVDATQIREIHHKQYSHYNMISIPLGLGYQTTNRNGSFHQYLGGLEWTPILFTKGNVLKDNDYHLAAIKNHTKSNAGLGLWAEYKYGRRWNKKTGWYIAPTFQFHFSPMTKDKAFISEKLNFLGVRLGITIL